MYVDVCRHIWVRPGTPLKVFFFGGKYLTQLAMILAPRGGCSVR